MTVEEIKEAVRYIDRNDGEDVEYYRNEDGEDRSIYVPDRKFNAYAKRLAEHYAAEFLGGMNEQN